MINSPEVLTLSTSSSATTALQNLTFMFGWDATVVITDATPTAKTFVYLSGNNFTIASHGYLVGLKVQVSTTTTLPTGLSAMTDYYVIVVDANTVALATSQALALAGTAITITGAGSGVQTMTPQALAGTIVAQKSDVAHSVTSYQAGSAHAFTIATPTTAASQNISVTTLNYYDNQAMYTGLQFLAAVTGGQAAITIYLNCKGE